MSFVFGAFDPLSDGCSSDERLSVSFSLGDGPYPRCTLSTTVYGHWSVFHLMVISLARTAYAGCLFAYIF